MSFADIFKKNFLDNFTGSINIQLVLVTLLIALLFAVIVFFVYKLTSKNTIYSKNFNITMSLVGIITASIVLSMQANIIVSLGMVGALSIVRFRTAIKEPRDLLFLFWSISNGIIIGAGVYSIVFILALIIIIGLFGFDLIPGNKIPYLLIINYKDKEVDEKIVEVFKLNRIKYKLKSRNFSKNKIDCVYELTCKNSSNLFDSLSTIDGVSSFNLLSQDGECQF